MRLFPRPSDSSVYQGGLFNEQELVWLNLCSRVYDVSSSQLDPLLSTTREVMEVIEVTSVFNSCYTLHEINMEMMQSNPK